MFSFNFKRLLSVVSLLFAIWSGNSFAACVDITGRYICPGTPWQDQFAQMTNPSHTTIYSKSRIIRNQNAVETSSTPDVFIADSVPRNGVVAACNETRLRIISEKQEGQQYRFLTDYFQVEDGHIAIRVGMTNSDLGNAEVLNIPKEDVTNLTYSFCRPWTPQDSEPANGGGGQVQP